eukprot:scaffold125882_cov47-Prasinocladus_malaysianus.AAC.1
MVLGLDVWAPALLNGSPPMNNISGSFLWNWRVGNDSGRIGRRSRTELRESWSGRSACMSMYGWRTYTCAWQLWATKLVMAFSRRFRRLPGKSTAC